MCFHSTISFIPYLFVVSLFSRSFLYFYNVVIKSRLCKNVNFLHKRVMLKSILHLFIYVRAQTDNDKHTLPLDPKRQPLGNNPILQSQNPTRLPRSCDLSLQANETKPNESKQNKTKRKRDKMRLCVLFTFYVDLFLPCNLNAQTFKFRRRDHLMASSAHTATVLVSAAWFDAMLGWVGLGWVWSGLAWPGRRDGDGSLGVWSSALLFSQPHKYRASEI